MCSLSGDSFRGLEYNGDGVDGVDMGVLVKGVGGVEAVDID